ncbi:uncharacterized protein LOC117787747 [Drosophila innubila]|uniref:uncharacterized protein LOC117787747 n=1 Tax=Drosophila innubila TaxID=198719 RepID=UPI00148D07E1|nr:uncharacterized protein LOC117787747 [Drosophila innubila]
MCFLGFETLRFLTVIFAFLLAICNITSICVSLNNLDNCSNKVQMILTTSLGFDFFVNLAICLGIFGVLRKIVTCIYVFICTLICFFVVKIIVAKAIVNFDEKDIEQIVTVWYQFDVVFAGFCLMCATPLSLKLAEKQTDVV